MRKVFVIALFFCAVSHQQSFCPRGPRHHLKRLNAPKDWELNRLGGIMAAEFLREQKQKELKQAMHQRIMAFKEQRRKKNLK